MPTQVCLKIWKGSWKKRMIKRIMIFFKYSSQRILFSEILKLCLAFQKEMLYLHSSQLSIIPTLLPALHTVLSSPLSPPCYLPSTQFSALHYPHHATCPPPAAPQTRSENSVPAACEAMPSWLDDATAFAYSEIKRVFSFYASDSLAGGFVLLFTHLRD